MTTGTEVSIRVDRKAASPRRRVPAVVWHEELADTGVAGGARDHSSIEAILTLIPTLSRWSQQNTKRRVVDGTRAVLEWLTAAEGDGWQARWLAAGADENTDWVEDLIVPDHPLPPRAQRYQLFSGISSLILLRIVFPSYELLTGYSSSRIYGKYRLLHRPDLFAKVEARADALGVEAVHRVQALTTITKIATRVGRDLDQLTATDLLAYRAWNRRRGQQVPAGLSLGWTLLAGIADLGEHDTLEKAIRRGQLTSAELVDHYEVKASEVREVFVRYLDERRPGLDYASWANIATHLLGGFWHDIQTHQPELGSLNLPTDVVDAWKLRLRTSPTRLGGSRSDADYFQILVTVRAFYRDLQEWSLQDPYWARWSFPNPIRKSDTAGTAKAQHRRTAAMHQRIRDRLTHLPMLVDTAGRHRAGQAALLKATKQTPIGDTFEHAGRGYRRIMPAVYHNPDYRRDTPPDLIEDLATGEVIEIGRDENDAFWAWAAIEVLRHSGIRIEELLEITHLALVAYSLPTTGEVVPPTTRSTRRSSFSPTWSTPGVWPTAPRAPAGTSGSARAASRSNSSAT